MGAFVGLIFTYCPFMIPIKKVKQDRFAVSTKHPFPSYQNHVLMLPRKLARNIFCLSANDFVETIEIAKEIRNKDDRDFALLINGGNRQDVMQAHFHLFTGNMVVEKGLSRGAGKTFNPRDMNFWAQITSLEDKDHIYWHLV
jgi:diadenosine tetraphosphate (Ap4A) HIT family hydrolase